jgi:hypothetical protein
VPLRLTDGLRNCDSGFSHQIIGEGILIVAGYGESIL